MLKQVLCSKQFDQEELVDALIRAVYKKSEEIVMLLLDYGADPNYLVKSRCNIGIFSAAEHTNINILKILLEHERMLV